MTRIQELMKELLNTQGARVAVLVGWDGFVIEGAARSEAFELDALGAVISTSLGSAQVIGRELKVGDISLAMLEFEKGTVLVRAMGSTGLLALMVDPDTSLGLPRHQLRKWAPAIEAQLA